MKNINPMSKHVQKHTRDWFLCSARPSKKRQCSGSALQSRNCQLCAGPAWGPGAPSGLEPLFWNLARKLLDVFWRVFPHAMGIVVSKKSYKRKYKVKYCFARGSFGAVYKATRRSDGSVVAIKKILKKNLDEEEIKNVKTEVMLMGRIDHPYCVKFFEVYETKKKFYLIMEYLDGGEIFDRIMLEGTFSEKRAAQITRQITNGLAYLHGIGIVHRDIKPANVIFDSHAPESDVKLVDFGLAADWKPGTALKEPCGTPEYAAPEVLRQKYDNRADFWSLGVLVFVMLSGTLPFPDKDNRVKFKKIKKGQYEFKEKYWRGISEDAKDLVRNLLIVDPNKRLDAKGILGHKWIHDMKHSRERAFTMGKIGRLKAMTAPEPEPTPILDGEDSELEGLDDSSRHGPPKPGDTGGENSQDNSTNGASAPYGNSRRPSMAVGARVTYAKGVSKVDKKIELPENMRRQSMVDPLNPDMGRLRGLSQSSPGNSNRGTRISGQSAGQRGSWESRGSQEGPRGSWRDQQRSSDSGGERPEGGDPLANGNSLTLSPPSSTHRRGSSSGSTTLETLPEDGQPLQEVTRAESKSRPGPRGSKNTLDEIPESPQAQSTTLSPAARGSASSSSPSARGSGEAALAEAHTPEKEKARTSVSTSDASSNNENSERDSTENTAQTTPER
eukprot:g19886.t1